jgi:hypothetical protein
LSFDVQEKGIAGTVIPTLKPANPKRETPYEHAADPQDHGFMYMWSFYDLDGHHWEVFWMDPSAVNG